MLVIFLGAPGSGKGTQASFLRDKGFKHLSTGDLLRIESTKDTPLGIYLSQTMYNGELVSDEIVNQIIVEYIKKPEFTHLLLDGYPRTLSQAIYLQQNLEDNYIVFHFNIETEKLRQRVGNRFNCVGCGKIYNAVSHPTTNKGVCDECQGAEFAIRKDDNIDLLIQRVEVYNNTITSILSFYKDKSKLFQINADLPTREVTAQIHRIISDISGEL